MAKMLCAVAAAVLAVPIAALVTAQDSDCNGNNVVFDKIDSELHVRTMVVEDSSRQRMLVLTAENDTSMPCKPRWWLDHNPQGSVQCSVDAVAKSDTKASACDAMQCKSDPTNVQLGYVRTMLASAIFVPQVHTISAICIELGCRSRIRKTSVGTLLETDKVQWGARPHIKKMLIIGLGTSSMALWVRKELPDTELHIVELVPGVADAAPCFGLDSNSGKDKNLHIHVGDGRSVLQGMADGQFDSILVDAFDHSASLPPCFRTSEFFAMTRHKLTPGGSLSLNLFSDSGAKTRIVKALMGSFDKKRIWVGEAPGAQGIQEVVTAFAPGRPLAHAGAGVVDASDSGHAHKWWGEAHYRLLNTPVLRDVKAFEDVSECPDKNAVHHG